MLDNFKCGDYVFNSNFDSGNLNTVELVQSHGDILPPDKTAHTEFNVCTRPDCGGTEYENQNRSWFFFSIHGGDLSRVCKINVINMNKQAKLYAQGMQTVRRIGEAPAKWERIKDPATHYVKNDQFYMSFLHKPHTKLPSHTRYYYAFTYPFSYTDCQDQLARFDAAHQKNPFKVNYIIQRLMMPVISHKSLVTDPIHPLHFGANNFIGRLNRMSRTELESEIYYHRELLIDSVEFRRVDLLTISSFHNIQLEREQRLEHLFPDKKTVRCNTFKHKKIIFLSSRVHPGETPASFVLNGFLKMIFDQQSPVAAALRKMYVFKIVPILNPDGVFNGHYRSDTFGINLNRMYTDPALETQPTIYAVRKLIRYYHYGQDLPEQVSPIKRRPEKPKARREQACPTVIQRNDRRIVEPPAEPSIPITESSTNQSSDSETVDTKSSVTSSTATTSMTSNTSTKSSNSSSTSCPSTTDSEVDLPNKIIICDEADGNREPAPRNAATRVFHNLLIPEIKPVVVVADSKDIFPKKGRQQSYSASMRAITTTRMSPCVTPRHAFLLSGRNRQLSSAGPSNMTAHNQTPAETQIRITKRRNTGTAISGAKSKKEKQLADDASPDIDNGNVFLYIDMHGHASKKGVFMYGNNLPTKAEAVECLLLPRLMSMNSQHFHFESCVFSEKNMYSTGKRDGMSKEGSGRVSVYKATGLVKCYTLEGNYNTGKFLNVLPPIVKDAAARKPSLTVPKYTPAIFEEVGRALGPSILDLTGSNPISRIQNSEFRSVSGLRKAMRIELDRSMAGVFVGASKLLNKQQRTAKRTKQPSTKTHSNSTLVQTPASSKNPSKENKTKSSAVLGAFPRPATEILITTLASTKKPVLADHHPLSPKKKRSISIHTMIPIDSQDASTSSKSLQVQEAANSMGGETSRSSIQSSLFYSASETAIGNVSADEDTEHLREPEQTIQQQHIGFGKKSTDSSKLFVSGRRKTLKVRPKSSMIGVASALVAGSSTGTRTKPMKRGSPSASKDSLRLKKKNKVLKVDDNIVAAPRTKARLL